MVKFSLPTAALPAFRPCVLDPNDILVSATTNWSKQLKLSEGIRQQGDASPYGFRQRCCLNVSTPFDSWSSEKLGAVQRPFTRNTSCSPRPLHYLRVPSVLTAGGDGWLTYSLCSSLCRRTPPASLSPGRTPQTRPRCRRTS